MLSKTWAFLNCIPLQFYPGRVPVATLIHVHVVIGGPLGESLELGLGLQDSYQGDLGCWTYLSPKLP